MNDWPITRSGKMRALALLAGTLGVAYVRKPGPEEAAVINAETRGTTHHIGSPSRSTLHGTGVIAE